jgi:asparagine synthase (glutamine-hydrolysing)
MCGISGFNWEDKEKVEAMVSCLSHRGPDAQGIYTDKNISLGHNRLSIIDLSPEANQPMYDQASEIVIVYNGEIYNFKDLKKELAGEYEFKTQSDTEVILAGYRKWGKKVVDKLNGMFAFAIWDKRDSTLFLARDHAGVKPLYYFWDGKKFIFASEIPGILTHDIPRKLDTDAFNHYLRVLYAPEPMTLIKNIYKLPPSHSLILKNGALTIEAHSQMEKKESHLSYGEAVSLLRKTTIEAVGRQLVADVPVGVYLSGGIDSSSVLFSMTQFRKEINAFSVGFELSDEQESKKFNEDLELAKETAKFFRVNHHTLLVSTKDVIKNFEEMSYHNSDPVSHPTSVAMMLLARFAKQKATVILTGNGGDELFGGYDRYRFALGGGYYQKLSRFLRAILNLHPQLAKLEHDHDVDLFARFMFEKDKKLSPVISPKVFKPGSFVKKYFQEKYLSRFKGDMAENFMRTDEVSWLPDYFFSLSDKMSMASGLEERVPLVDKELVAFSRSIPRSYKLDLFKTKKILKDAFRNDLPEALFNQPKRGWFSPGAKWFRDREFSVFAKRLLSSGYYDGTRGLFEWSEVETMLERHISKEEYNLTILWAILSFQAWAKKFSITV